MIQSKNLDLLLKAKKKKKNITLLLKQFDKIQCLLRKIKAHFLHSKVDLSYQVWLLTRSMIKS